MPQAYFEMISKKSDIYYIQNLANEIIYSFKIFNRWPIVCISC